MQPAKNLLRSASKAQVMLEAGKVNSLIQFEICGWHAKQKAVQAESDTVMTN